MKLHVTIDMPDDELRTVLRLLRHWEGGRPEIRVVITGEGGALRTEDVAQMLRTLDPPLPSVQVVPVPQEDTHAAP